MFSRYQAHAATPPYPDEGVVLLAPRARVSLRDGEPLWLYGALRLPRQQLTDLRGHPLRGVALILRGDRLACWSLARSRLLFDDDLLHDQQHLLAAFNVELRSELGLPPEPGRYWASAAVLGYRSEVLELEVTP